MQILIEESGDLIHLTIKDTETRTEVTLIEGKESGLSGFNMFHIGRWMIKTIKPKYQKIIRGEHDKL